jgi:hypothetical protein
MGSYDVAQWLINRSCRFLQNLFVYLCSGPKWNLAISPKDFWVQPRLSTANRWPSLAGTHTVATKLAVTLILPLTLHLLIQEHSLASVFHWIRACSEFSLFIKFTKNCWVTPRNHKSPVSSLEMHIWTDIPELSLIVALQKWLNLHFGLEQSCTNKFCKNGNSCLLCNTL